MWIKIITFFSIKHTHFFSLNSQTLSIYHQKKNKFLFQLDLFSSDGGEGDMTNYQENGEFKLESFRAEKSYVYYSCCTNPFPDITFFIELRRRPMFYVFNLILPCVLINGIGKTRKIFFELPKTSKRTTIQNDLKQEKMYNFYGAA